ncbi:unnamed protein product [Rhodiola kirilowii]
MAQAVNIIASNISGQTDGRCIPCLRISRGVLISPQSFCGNYKTLAHARIASKQCASKCISFVCKASYNGHRRRNPDFYQHNRQENAEINNWKFEETDSSENLEHPGLSSVTDGLMNSLSGTPRFKVTETPGPKEKEIVELFRKIQAQLRERSTFKEQKKMESMQGKYEERGTVDSLLKLLRKHSSEQGVRKLNGNANSELDTGNHSIQNGVANGFKNTGFSNASNHASYETKQPTASNSFRPASYFRSSSPVSQSKNPPPAYRRRNATDFKPYIRNKSVTNPPEPALKPEIEFATDLQHEINPEHSNMNDAFHEVSSEESSNFNNNFESEEAAESAAEEKQIQTSDSSIEEASIGGEQIQTRDFSTLKLTDLRSIARSHGVKGFSKLKKSELVKLLSNSSL